MATQAAPRERLDGRAGVRVWRTELSPVSFLVRATEVHAGATALVHGTRRHTYRELGERVARLTSALRALGIGPGDRVAVLAPNTPAMVEAHFAVPSAGALLVCINIRQSPGEVARLLEHAEPKVVLVHAEYEALLSSFDTSAVEVVRIADTGAPDDPYERLVASGSPGHPLDGPPDEEDALAINYTSGTTGDPKGVVYTHRGAYLNALANVIEAGLTPRPSACWSPPSSTATAGASRGARCRRRGDDRVPAPGRPRRDVAVDRRGGRHQPQQRPHGPDRAGQPRRRAPRCPPAGSPPATGGSPPSPTLLGPPPRAEHHPAPPLRPDRDVRADHASAWTRAWELPARRAPHISWRARARRT